MATGPECRAFLSNFSLVFFLNTNPNRCAHKSYENRRSRFQDADFINIYTNFFFKDIRLDVLLILDSIESFMISDLRRYSDVDILYILLNKCQ